jgi:hypothetical protein
MAAIYVDNETASSFLAIVAALNYALFFAFSSIDRKKDEADSN